MYCSEGKHHTLLLWSTTKTPNIFLHLMTIQELQTFDFWETNHRNHPEFSSKGSQLSTAKFPTSMSHKGQKKLWANGRRPLTSEEANKSRWQSLEQKNHKNKTPRTSSNQRHKQQQNRAKSLESTSIRQQIPPENTVSTKQFPSFIQDIPPYSSFLFLKSLTFP